MDNLRELRLSLVEAEHALREAKDHFIAAKAECEQAAINSGRASGKNAEERDRNMALALARAEGYQHELHRLRKAEYSRDRAEAILESAKDARRKWEWDIRSRLADGLFRQGVQSDHQDYAGDSAFDDTFDHYGHARAISEFGADLDWS